VNNFDCILNSAAKKLFQAVNHALIVRFKNDHIGLYGQETSVKKDNISSIEFGIKTSKEKAENDIINFFLLDDEGKRIFSALVYRLAHHTIDLGDFYIRQTIISGDDHIPGSTLYVKFTCYPDIIVNSLQKYKNTDLYKCFHIQSLKEETGMDIDLYRDNMGGLNYTFTN
jgi:hypothetical protein